MKKILLLLTLLYCCLFAQTKFLKSSTDVELNGKKIAVASVLTPIYVTNQNKGLVTGFVQENYQEKIVKSPFQNEEYMIFSKDGTASYEGDKNPYIKILEETQDDYGEIWFKCSMEFDLAPDSTVNDAKPLYEEAKNLYEQTCSACHILHEPSVYTVNQWPSQVESMVNSGFVAIEPIQKDIIIKYLQHNAKDAKL